MDEYNKSQKFGCDPCIAGETMILRHDLAAAHGLNLEEQFSGPACLRKPVFSKNIWQFQESKIYAKTYQEEKKSCNFDYIMFNAALRDHLIQAGKWFWNYFVV